MTTKYQWTAAAALMAAMVALVVLLVFVPLPRESEGVVLILMGVLAAQMAKVVPVLLGITDDEKIRLRERIAHLEKNLALVEGQYETLQRHYEYLLNQLVSRHVIPPEPQAAEQKGPKP